MNSYEPHADRIAELEAKRVVLLGRESDILTRYKQERILAIESYTERVDALNAEHAAKCEPIVRQMAQLEKQRAWTNGMLWVSIGVVALSVAFLLAP